MGFLHFHTTTILCHKFSLSFFVTFVKFMITAFDNDVVMMCAVQNPSLLLLLNGIFCLCHMCHPETKWISLERCLFPVM